MATVGEQIRNARKAKSMTQDDLAEAMHVTRTSVSKWETNVRVPDANTLLKLSDVLNYRFTQETRERMEEDHTAAEDAAEDTSDPLPATESEAVTSASWNNEVKASAERQAEADRQTAPPQALLKRNIRIKLLLLCAIIVIAVLAGMLFWHPFKTQETKISYADEGGTIYDVADYKALTKDDPTKAYLTITPKLEIQQTSNGPHFMYDFKIVENNGIGFHIDRLQHVCFFYSGSATVDDLTAQDLIDFGENPDLLPYGTFELQCGINARTTDTGEPNAIGAGLKVIGTDANGEQLVFTAYISFPVE